MTSWLELVPAVSCLGISKDHGRAGQHLSIVTISKISCVIMKSLDGLLS